MDLLNISYTKESSVLTEGEMSFTLYENTNMANTRIMYCYFETHMNWHHGLVLSVSDFGTRGPGSIPGCKVGSHVVSVRIHCTEKWRTSFPTDVLSKSK